MISIEELIEKVSAMRNAQKNYFKASYYKDFPNKAIWLQESKKLEREIDELLNDLQ